MISNKIENDQFKENLSGIHQLVSSHTDILVKPRVQKHPRQLRGSVPSGSEHTSS